VIEEQSAHREFGLAVKNFMEPGFPTVPPGMDVDTVVRILQNNHAVLVMEAGTVTGVITKHDLISLIVDRAP
ncbi:MAG TPA: CBS domain-containing protein, partial [Methanoregulaceae archaeon]|nr:CBS domain-containing protein [Methanoregulaceae archaeon]